MNKQVDKMLSSNNPWVVLLGCTIGTPVLVAVFLSRALRRGENLDGLTPTVFGLIVAGSAVLGLLIGLSVTGFNKYQELKKNSVEPPWLLRLFFDSWQLKLAILSPILIVILLVVAAMTA